ncbi:chitin binding peritrophin-A domain-containing protein [Sorangium sp. So ce260]|uniref:chitin binding peritrophin-A domain-containing protein n=1 Tax=Sorangium sp. So ce260 TaxID=3133291 RepID=UPI003F624C4E
MRYAHPPIRVILSVASLALLAGCITDTGENVPVTDDSLARSTALTLAVEADEGVSVSVGDLDVSVTLADEDEGDYCKVECNGLLNFIPDPEDCNYFYQCTAGIPYRHRCPLGLVFNPTIGVGVCDWPSSYDCKVGCD